MDCFAKDRSEIVKIFFFNYMRLYVVVGRYWWCLISLIHSFLPFLFPPYSSISLH
ncbi:hypothetical protein Scep_023389 [Stephania cephalantha]|uniref:Uncharacterized protein n=1 Tax=Stephania cephalantha TaxID=152367 RepID=A0AAP0HXB1_9MAGN